jgi:hypothetical protein
MRCDGDALREDEQNEKTVFALFFQTRRMAKPIARLTEAFSAFKSRTQRRLQTNASATIQIDSQLGRVPLQSLSSLVGSGQVRVGGTMAAPLPSANSNLPSVTFRANVAPFIAPLPMATRPSANTHNGNMQIFRDGSFSQTITPALSNSITSTPAAAVAAATTTTTAAATTIQTPVTASSGSIRSLQSVAPIANLRLPTLQERTKENRINPTTWNEPLAVGEGLCTGALFVNNLLLFPTIFSFNPVETCSSSNAFAIEF